MFLPPDHPNAPKYWMYETGGELKAAVMEYLHDNALNPRQVMLMKAYLHQWVMSPVWMETEELKLLRANVAAIQKKSHLDSCISLATAMGMDPL